MIKEKSRTDRYSGIFRIIRIDFDKPFHWALITSYSTEVGSGDEIGIYKWRYTVGFNTAPSLCSDEIIANANKYLVEYERFGFDTIQLAESHLMINVNSDIESERKLHAAKRIRLP